MPPRIEPARSPAELAAFVRLCRAYAASLGIDLAYQDFEAELAALPGKYAPPRGEILLAWQGDEPVGCAALRPLSPEVAEMKRLYVAPEGRGLGLGRALAERIVGIAAGIGYREIRLDTLATLRPALALYRSLGFVRISPYNETPVEDTVFMSLPLPRGVD